MGAELNDERELSTLTRLACGGLAGTTGQTVAYPLDVVRRRMQVHLSHSALSLAGGPMPHHCISFLNFTHRSGILDLQPRSLPLPYAWADVLLV